MWPFKRKPKNPLIEDVHRALRKPIEELLLPGETVEVRLSGMYKEALVCTDRRVLIVKSGYMTGNTFGRNVFQMPYDQISGVQVRVGFATGFFEISGGGMQNAQKSVWAGIAGDASRDPAKAPNCITLNSSMRSKYEKAAALITERSRRSRVRVVANLDNA